MTRLGAGLCFQLHKRRVVAMGRDLTAADAARLKAWIFEAIAEWVGFEIVPEALNVGGSGLGPHLEKPSGATQLRSGAVDAWISPVAGVPASAAAELYRPRELPP